MAKMQSKGTPAKDSVTITPDSVRAKMNLPANMRQAYQTTVLAAKKIMYSDVMKPQIEELLKSQMTTGQKLGQGVVALMALLRNHTNNTLPPQLMFPVATEMVAEAADFLRKAGVNVGDRDIAEGMFVMVQSILQQAKIPMDQLPQVMKKYTGA